MVPYFLKVVKFYTHLIQLSYARMAKLVDRLACRSGGMVDTQCSERCTARCGGSNPLFGSYCRYSSDFLLE